MAITSVFSDFLDMILPPRCLVTGAETDAPGMLSPTVWAKLNFITQPICACCGVPFDIDLRQTLPDNPSEDLLCAPCLDNPPPFARARAALRYDEASRDLILAFKHGDRTDSTRTFIPWILRAGADLLQETDALLPVPLHRWRLLRRRYNQAGLIAAALARAIGKPVLPDSLVRTKNTSPQGHKTPNERADNIRAAFKVPMHRREKIADQKLLLVDDVYTSGATVRACTQTLLNAGAARVDVLTLARAVRAS